MQRYELVFQFLIGSTALTLLNKFMYHDRTAKAVGVSMVVWLAFCVGRLGGRFFRRFHSKLQQ